MVEEVEVVVPVDKAIAVIEEVVVPEMACIVIPRLLITVHDMPCIVIRWLHILIITVH